MKVTQKTVVVTWAYSNFKKTDNGDLVTVCNPKWLDQLSSDNQADPALFGFVFSRLNCFLYGSSSA